MSRGRRFRYTHSAKSGAAPLPIGGECRQALGGAAACPHAERATAILRLVAAPSGSVTDSAFTSIEKTSPILIVDDSPAILALLKDMLRAHGYKDIRTAESVEEGMKAVEERHPAVIFLDLLMPESSGIEFAKSAAAVSPESRVVVTTALPIGHEAVTMAISQGASEYLPKPLRDDALTVVLNHLAQGPHSSRREDVGYY